MLDVPARARRRRAPPRLVHGLLVLVAALASAGASACEEVPRTFSSADASSEAMFVDHFSREALGPDWRATGDGATLEAGALVVEGVQNHPVWLTRPLPDDVRIDFDTWTDSDEGDIKFELAGDGASAATSMNYVASGYVVIFGGWNNSLSGVFRKQEHGNAKQVSDRVAVEPGRRYHVTLTRIGPTIRFELDAQEVVTYEDPRPLHGEGQRHFAFSGWESRVHFDNLEIRAL
ncbi:MAG: hypothetical protein KC468_04360 [Myxococcales bacterium]|nr:hypothetical protein [Myxococcales bacterium]